MAKKVDWFVKDPVVAPDSAKTIRVKGELKRRENGGAIIHVGNIEFTVKNDPDFEVIRAETKAILLDIIEIERIQRDKVAVLEDVVENFVFSEEV
jgi:hypothetical protein